MPSFYRNCHKFHGHTIQSNHKLVRPLQTICNLFLNIKDLIQLKKINVKQKRSLKSQQAGRNQSKL